MDKIKEYKNKFPFGLEEFIKALSNNTRLAIASLLYDKESLGYEEILKYLGTKDEDKIIEHNIKRMISYGLVARTNSRIVDRLIISDYKLNKIYKELIKICIDRLEIRSLEKIK